MRHLLVAGLLATEHNADGIRGLEGALLVKTLDPCPLTGLAAVIVGQVQSVGTIQVHSFLAVFGTYRQMMPATTQVTDRGSHAGRERR